MVATPPVSGPRPDVSVVTSVRDVADARLHREVAALLRSGLDVEVLGYGDASAGPDGARVRIRARGGRISRAVAAVVAPWRARGRVLVVLDPDLVPSALARSAMRRGAVVVDMSEDYARLLHDRAWAHGAAGVVARIVVSVSTRAARAADLTVVADHHVQPFVARRRMVVRNLPDLSMLPEAGEPDPHPRAVYVGDVRASRGLGAMLEAVERAPRWTLDVVGPVAPDDAALVERFRSSSAAAGRVRWHGRLVPRDAWRVAAGAWAGLSLLRATPAFVDAIPSKLYEYAASGIAAVVTDLPRQRGWLEAGGVGALVPTGDDASVGAAVARTLEEWADDPTPVLRARERAASLRTQPTDYDAFAAAVSSLVAGG